MGSFKDAAGIAARIIARQAYSHAVSLLFGYAEDVTGEAIPKHYIASAGLIDFGGTLCAVTAYHVLRNFELVRKKEARYRFQIGAHACEPTELLRDCDERLDLAILDVSEIPINRLSNREEPVQPLKPVRWPNEPVKREDFVVLCGFPEGMREIAIDEREIGSIAFPLIERVMDVDENSFIISLERDVWVSVPDDRKAPAEVRQADLNGLSGSPVFSGLRTVSGAIAMIEFVGTVLHEVPFATGLRVRSSRCIDADGRIAP